MNTFIYRSDEPYIPCIYCIKYHIYLYKKTRADQTVAKTTYYTRQYGISDAKMMRAYTSDLDK